MATAPAKTAAKKDDAPVDDPLNPTEDQPSGLEETTHEELLAIYHDASENLRFAKDHQWRSVFYFSIGATLATGYCAWTGWEDKPLAQFLLIMIWIFSFSSVFVIASLQWWQSVEHHKIEYVTSKWSKFANAARGRKSPRISDVQRYGMLIAMILYLELASIAVTRIFLSKM